MLYPSQAMHEKVRADAPRSANAAIRGDQARFDDLKIEQKKLAREIELPEQGLSAKASGTIEARRV